MSLCAFFGFIISVTKNRKIYDYDKCKEYYLSDDKLLIPIARNNLITLNAGTNDYLKSLKSININYKTNYRPAYAILRYMKEINRPVTKFELSILLGRIDSLKTESEILKRALEIGISLPKTKKEQIPYFFENMKWKNNEGESFTYSASQEPYFKFNSFILLMESFGLIQYDRITDTVLLTQYSKDLISEDISYSVLDLERLLSIIDDYEEDNKELNDLILYQRYPELLRLVRDDTDFIKKMNMRSINKPVYDNNGKKIRNKLICELAKIQVNYTCQYALKHIFKMPNGKYYCEAHHIIEFNNENGPDITNNLVVLGPEAHMIIHHACKEEVDNVYLQLIHNGALNLTRFKEMATLYNCLTIEHINVLSNKRIITSNEKKELINLLSD